MIVIDKEATDLVAVQTVIDANAGIPSVTEIKGQQGGCMPLPVVAPTIGIVPQKTAAVIVLRAES